MIAGSRLRRRSLGSLTAGLLAVAALAGCGSSVEGQASPASPSSSDGVSGGSSTSDSPSGGSGSLDDVADLSAGLLPGEAFGAGAQVTPVTADQLEQQSQLGGLGALEDVTITPESCAPAVEQVQPGLEGLDGLAAQAVTVGTGAVIEVLAEGADITAGVDQLGTTVESCPQATISSPQFGTADVSFAPLDVPDLGDGAAGVTMTISVAGPDGQPVSVPVLLGMVADGDRLVSLTSTDPTGASDPTEFVGLLQQAYEHAAGALD